MDPISIKEEDRLIFLVVGCVIASVFLMLSLLFLSDESRIAILFFDIAGKLGAFPFTVQGFMWLIFFLALADAVYLYLLVEKDKRGLRAGLLPENKSKMINHETAKQIYAKTTHHGSSDSAIPFLILKTLNQFFSTKSLSRAKEVFNNSTRLLGDRYEVKFTFIRYVAWLLPTIGFIGTVIGISLALNVAAVPPLEMDGVSMRDWMGSLTGELGYAFDTTLLALMQSALIMFTLSQIQAHADRVLIDCEEYCLDNLINKLLVSRGHD